MKVILFSDLHSTNPTVTLWISGEHTNGKLRLAFIGKVGNSLAKQEILQWEKNARFK